MPIFNLAFFCFQSDAVILLGADGSECQVDGMPTPAAKVRRWDMRISFLNFRKEKEKEKEKNKRKDDDT